MTNCHVKECLTSLVIREMKINISMRYQHTPTRTAKIKQTDNTNFGENVEQPELSHRAGGKVKWYHLSGKS